jgi:hypothetical protein
VRSFFVVATSFKKWLSKPPTCTDSLLVKERTASGKDCVKIQVCKKIKKIFNFSEKNPFPNRYIYEER